MPIESHDVRRTGSPRRRGFDADSGSDFWWQGREAPEDSADRLGGELGGSGVRCGWGRKTERKGSEVGGRRLLKALRCAGQREKGQGGPGGHCMEGGSLGSWHRPPTGVRGRHHCRATGEGAGGRVTLVRAADRRDRATTGPGGQRLGAGRE
jgi:hypothetical protein